MHVYIYVFLCMYAYELLQINKVLPSFEKIPSKTLYFTFLEDLVKKLFEIVYHANTNNTADDDYDVTADSDRINTAVDAKM